MEVLLEFGSGQISLAKILKFLFSVLLFSFHNIYLFLICSLESSESESEKETKGKGKGKGKVKEDSKDTLRQRLKEEIELVGKFVEYNSVVWD